MFTDPAYAKSGGGGNFLLSTSTSGYTGMSGGTAAMVPDGYGCFYNFETEPRYSQKKVFLCKRKGFYTFALLSTVWALIAFGCGSQDSGRGRKLRWKSFTERSRSLLGKLRNCSKQTILNSDDVANIEFFPCQTLTRGHYLAINDIISCMTPHFF